MSVNLSGSNTNGSLRERKRKHTSEQILRSARDLFTLKPFDEVTMDELASHASVSKPTLYNYFRGKEDIYFAIAVRGVEKKLQNLRHLARSSLQGREKIERMITDMFSDILINPLQYQIERKFVGLMHEEGGRLERHIRSLISSNISVEEGLVQHLSDNPYSAQTVAALSCSLLDEEKIWSSVVEEGQRDGSIRNDHDPKLITQVLFLAIYGISNQFLTKQNHLELFGFTKNGIRDVIVQMLGRYLGP